MISWKALSEKFRKVRSWFRRKFKDLLIKRHQSKRTNVKLKYEMLKKEEESAWFTENGLY